MAERHPTDWLTSANPDAMLPLLVPEVYSAYGPLISPRDLPEAFVRQFQLFGCACARTVWDMLPTDARSGVATRERYADGRAGDDELRATALRHPAHAVTAQQYAATCAARAVGVFDQRSPDYLWDPFFAARNAAKALAARAARQAPADYHKREKWHSVWNATFAAARAYQAELLRDIFPPPGYTPVLHPDWRTDTVLALAKQMDDTGDYFAVPILADALQDAGCDDDILLARCRAESGIHCRGNWVVDLVLGRE